MMTKTMRILSTRCRAYDTDCAELEMEEINNGEVFSDEEEKVTADSCFSVVSDYVDGNHLKLKV